MATQDLLEYVCERVVGRLVAQRLGYSVPLPPLTYDSVRLDWVHFSLAEAQALVFELHRAGVDLEGLLEQMAAFPYKDISLAWLTGPEDSLHMHTTLLDRMGEEAQARGPESMARLRRTVEFIHRLAALIPEHVRIWLQGWSAAYTHAAFARAVGVDGMTTDDG